MSENMQENMPENNDEPLLKDTSTRRETSSSNLKPVFKPGRPRKTDEEKAQTRRAMLDRRNERNKERTQLTKEQPLTKAKEQPTNYSHHDPLFNDKMEMEKKLLQKKYMIEDKRLDLYLQQLNTPPPVVKPTKPRAPRKPKIPAVIVPTGPKEKTPQEKANDIFRMYN